MNVFKTLAMFYTYVLDDYGDTTYITSCKFGEDCLKLNDIKLYPTYYNLFESDKGSIHLGRKVISDINGAIVNKIRFNKSTIEKNLNLILVNDNVEIV